GQLRPGDTVRFRRWDAALAAAALEAQGAMIAAIGSVASRENPPARRSSGASIAIDPGEAVLHLAEAPASHLGICLRRQGYANLLVEYGPLELDLRLRARVQALYEALRADGPPGILDRTPGIRSLQIHFDPRRLSLGRLVDTVLR